MTTMHLVDKMARIGVESAFEGGHGLSNSFLPPVAQPPPVSQPDDPIQALRENRGREVTRRAQVAGF